MAAVEKIRTMEFHDVVAKQLQIINDIFGEVGVDGLFENSDIVWDESWCFDNYLKFRLSRPDRNSLMLDFHLQSDGMQLDLEGYQEAYEFSAKEVATGTHVTEVLERLICNSVLVERKGGAQFVNLFNRDGSRYAIWALQSFTGLIFRGYWKSLSIDQFLYEPIYPRTRNQ